MPEQLNLENFKPRIRNVLENSLKIKLADPNINLVESGLIDSLNLIEFIVALENEFNIEISFDDLNIEQFKTINVIAAKVMDSKVRSHK